MQIWLAREFNAGYIIADSGRWFIKVLYVDYIVLFFAFHISFFLFSYSLCCFVHLFASIL